VGPPLLGRRSEREACPLQRGAEVRLIRSARSVIPQGPGE